MFYVAHRLFAAHDRQLGALVAARLSTEIGCENVFLPFCDTDEENLSADVKGRRLFELDRERLQRLDGMLAILHGPSLDDGVCMEIGFASTLGVPVVVLTTDFQTYGFAEQGPELAFPDPLVEAVATRVIRVDRMGPPPGASTDRLHAFAQRNQAQVHGAINTAVRCLLNHARTQTRSRQLARGEHAAFCEASPYHHRGDIWEKILAHLHATGVSVRRATRLNPGGNPVTSAHEDWMTLAGCDFLVVDVSGPETPPGAALMIGASGATGRRIIAIDPVPTWTFAQGREPNWRNLMIQYSVNARLVNVDTLGDLLHP